MKKRLKISKYTLANFLSKDVIDDFLEKREYPKLQDNIEIIEDNLEDLETFVGRELTDDEQLAVLNIVDKYTLIGSDGKYCADLFSFYKAWEMYQSNKNLLVKFLKNTVI